jgi:hypothetical protein
MSVVSALRRPRQEVLEFQDSLGYIIRPCLKKSKKRNKNRKRKKPLCQLGLFWLLTII